MHQNLHGQEARDQDIWSYRWGVLQKTLTGNISLTDGEPGKHFYDAGGSNRTITLPGARRGLNYEIFNTGDVGTLTVQTEALTTVAVVYANHSVDFISTETEWFSFGHIFGVAGAGHRPGLVPDVGSTVHPEATKHFLGEDGWQEIAEITGDDFYKYFTDGTTILTPTGADTVKFRSSDNTLTIVTTNNDATHGDNLNLVVNEAAVDHDILLNFVADEHVAHSGVNITTAANSGLAGGGTIAASRSLVLDLNNLAAATPVLADEFVFNDQDGNVPRNATLSTLNSILDHDALLNFTNDEHIDHTLVSISAGLGLTGGGTIASSRTLSLDITGQNADVPVGADEFIFWQVAGSDFDKVTLTTLNATLSHSALAGFVANEHVNHTTVSITGTGMLAGGGDLTASRTLNLAAAAAFTILANNTSGSAVPTALDISALTEKVTPANDDLFLIQDSAASNAFKKVKKSSIGGGTAASTTEVLTGTDTSKFVTADALAALWEKGSDVASAGTISLGEGGLFHITGTTTITDIDFATAKDGRIAILIFDGSLTLTHNATTLRLPGDADIQTAAGDRAHIVQDSSDNVWVIDYRRKREYPGGTQLIYGNIGTASIGAGLTRFVGVGSLLETTAPAAAFPLPAGKKILFRNLSVVGINPGAVGQTVTCTIHNAATATDSSVVATIVNGSNSGSDTTNIVTYDNNNGDRFSLKIVTSATCATQTQFFWSCEAIHNAA